MLSIQQQSKKAREMVGHSRDGNEGNVEYIIKSSHKPVGVLIWSCALPCGHLMPHGVQDSRRAEGRAGGTAVESTSKTWQEDGLTV